MSQKTPIAASELIINADGSAFHIHIHPEELADNVLLVGDPGRVGMVSAHFDAIECHHESREFFSTTGSFRGKRITVLSTGIGTDNIDIVMTELDALANIDFETRLPREEHRSLNILRIGTCGAIQPDIPLGAFIFSEISIGCDGLLNWYADRDKIALLDYEEAFKRHVGWAPHLTDPYFVRCGEAMRGRFVGQEDFLFGMTVSAPGFYGPQGRVLRLQLAMPDMVSRFESFRYDGRRIANFEMESSAIAGMAAHLGHNAATVCCAIANRYLGSSNVDYKALVASLIYRSLELI